MKKQSIKIIVLLAFSTAMLSSCAMEYQGHRRGTYDRYHHDRDHNSGHDRNYGHDHNYDDHHYNNH